MVSYLVLLTPKAHKDLEHIYQYISTDLMAEDAAKNLIEEIENAILGLDILPFRGSERRKGIYANKGYRQLFVYNFTIVYRVSEKQKEVIIVTVRYTPSQF